MPPREISHCRVVRQLGAGERGEVSLVQDSQRERPMALQVRLTDLEKALAENSPRLEVVNSGLSGRTYVHTEVSKNPEENGRSK